MFFFCYLYIIKWNIVNFIFVFCFHILCGCISFFFLCSNYFPLFRVPLHARHFMWTFLNCIVSFQLTKLGLELFIYVNFKMWIINASKCLIYYILCHEIRFIKSITIISYQSMFSYFFYQREGTRNVYID